MGVARSKHAMAEESDKALEILSNEESGTDRDDTKESMDQSTSESLQSGSPTVIFLAGSPKISNSCSQMKSLL